jgi:Protein of unknown function (DUF3800)
MIDMYCDESSDGTTYSLSGWVARPEAWDCIIPKWAEMLKRHNAPAFHAVEIVERERISDGRFKGWTFKQETAIFSDAADILLDKQCIGWPCAVGCSVHFPSIKSCFSIDEERTDANVWFLLFARLFHLLALEVPDASNGVNLMFDDKKEVQDLVNTYSHDAGRALKDLFPVFQNPVIAFDSDESMLPLQAADFFAYEWRKRISDKLLRSGKVERKSYTRLKHRPHLLRHYGEKEIANIRQISTESGKSLIEVMWEHPTSED